MAKLRFRISVSLDGFVAGPNQSLQEPLGIGGERLHEWVVQLETWRRSHGREGGEVNVSTPVLENEIAGIGATIVGRNMFGGGPGPWSETDPWNGWWGRTPPFHHPVFEQARRAAGGKDVALAGGAQAARQYLKAGLVDEMGLHVVPTLLGGGERLFDHVDNLHSLILVETIAAPDVVHLRFARTTGA